MPGLLEKLFGPNREVIWRELASQIGAHYLDGGWLGDDKIQLQVDDWTLTLDTYTVSTGKSSVTFTRMRAPFVNRDGFRFTVIRRNLFIGLGVKLGLVQDLTVGFEPFDSDFVIQASDPERVAELLSGAELRALIAAQPQIMLTVKDCEGWFGGRFPDGVDELCFEVVGVIKEIPRLRRLFELFAETLHRLGHLDSGHESDDAVDLATLRGPAGEVVSSKVRLWDSEPARCRAATALGGRKVAAAVPALVAALEDGGPRLRAKAAWALGEIGGDEAAQGLVGLLGDGAVVGGVTVADEAVESLRRLGHGELVDSFAAVLAGELARLAALRGPWQGPAGRAFLAVLDGPDLRRGLAAATALAELGAIGALPALRRRLAQRDQLDSVPEAEATLRHAVSRLEGLATLPQAATTPAPSTEALPRGVTDPEAPAGR